MKEFNSALTKAKVEFLKRDDAVFISTVCFYLNIVPDDSIPTAATDAVSMWINPDFMISLPKEQRVTLMAHETWHVVSDHVGRVGKRDHKKYNRAADYCINLQLKDLGYAPIPNWLCDEQYRGLSTEQIYDLLPDDDESGGAGDQWMDLKDPGMTAPELKEHLDDILIQAATAARMSGNPGSIPGDVQVYLDGLLKPKLPLNNLLRRFFTDLGKNDYTWKKPNKRFMPAHYLPSMNSGQTLMHLAFAFDMSGSVSDYDLKRYVTEVMNVLRMLKPDKLTLIQFDHGIRSVETIRTVGDMMRVKLTGRGGTSIHPLMDWAVTNKPNALIVFSDGEYQHPAVKPKCPVLWMIHGSSRHRFQCDFGKTILFDVSENKD